jgi:general L-amino acid transport system substrate-binding protein
VRAKEAKDPAAHSILPDLISKEPLGPMVRRGDDEWLAINKWVLAGLIEAEEYGITQANVDQMKTSDNPQVGRLLGVTEDLGKHLGLDKEWLMRAIKVTGNYGEMFERNVGPKTSINLPRGMNRQWSQGGLQYSAPLR